MGFPCGSAGEETACNTGDLDLIPGLGRYPGEGKGYPLVFWPGEFPGVYSPWCHKESDTTEWLSLFVGEDVRVWAHWNHSFHVHLSYPGARILCFSHPEFTRGSDCSLMAVRSCRYSSWVPLGLRNSHLEGWSHRQLWHPCLFIWQEILHFSYKNKYIYKNKSLIRTYHIVQGTLLNIPY